jgi:hypothetical protein
MSAGLGPGEYYFAAHTYVRRSPGIMGKEFTLALALIFHIQAPNRIIRIDLTVGLHPAGLRLFAVSRAVLFHFPSNMKMI